MEKPYSGLTAAIYVNSTLLGYMNNVTLTMERDIAEVLAFGAQYKEKLPTIKNWTASADGTVAFVSGGSQHKLYQAFESGEEVVLKIALDAAVYFQGNALISNLEISGSPDDALSISASFEGSGGVTFNLPETVVITVRSGVGGTTNPAGVIRVAKGATFAITCIPAAGKTSDKWSLDGGAGTTITSNTFSLTTGQTTADHTVEVTFKDA